MKVTLIDHMGTDLSVVNAARVSFAKESDWDYSSAPPDSPPEITAEYKKLSSQDTRLIKFLARNNHWTPFGHTSISLHVKAPIFVARQLGKHQVGLVWNEVSRRYVDDEPEFFVPEAWRKKAENVKQGSSDETVSRWSEQFNYVATSVSCDPGGDDQVECVFDYDDIVALCTAQYERLLALNVAPEMARMVLPQSMYTEWYWTGNLASFARVYGLRAAKDTQKETREIASQIGDILATLYPVSWEALTS